MIIFTNAFMNGATLFGIALTLFALTFALKNKLKRIQKIIFFLVAYLYLITSFVAFVFPSLSA